MKHYFHPMSRATTHWMLLELDVEHEQIVVDFMSGDAKKPEFCSINPMGKFQCWLMVLVGLSRLLRKSRLTYDV